MRRSRDFRRALWTTAALIAAGPALAADPVPSLADSFRLGRGAGTLCQVQSTLVDPAVTGMFDRGYAIACRDAAQPIGRLYALRRGTDDPAVRLAALRAARAACGSEEAVEIEGLGGARKAECRLAGADVAYRYYVFASGRTFYVAEGLSGYDSALTLGLRTIVADRIVPGEISVAITEAGDPAAFARAQAGTLSLESALAEGYRRNNSGSYAEAAEFFDALSERRDAATDPQQAGEFLVNRALQKSNLGDFAEADALFAAADRIPSSDPVQLRLRRNFKALHLLNQQRLAEAIAEADRPIRSVGSGGAAGPAAEIDATTAAELNGGARLARQLGLGDKLLLTPQEKARILDAQALQLRGTALRLQGDRSASATALNTALADLIAIREGRVTSITRLRAQILAEQAALAENGQDHGRAEALLREARALLEGEYPGSAAVNSAKARLAAFLARRGQGDAALALYREVVAALTASGGSATGFQNLLAPYFALLVERAPTQPALTDDFFLATQTLIRPGVADTSAVLARELSGGSDEASRLFRQSVNLTRDIELNRVERARFAAMRDPAPEDVARMAEIADRITALETNQSATQAKLAEFPRYRAISTQALTLPELRAALQPGEAYLKLAVVGQEVYGLAASRDAAQAFRAALSADALAAKVDAIRDTISKDERGQLVTYALDVTAARELYVALVQPADAQLAGARHIVFEPDGAMLRLPLNLLIADQASVDAYLARTARPRADEFDFRGIQWLGRRAEVSTAVSARAFRDVRQARPSSATRQYLGLGQNAPVSAFTRVAATRAVSPGGIDCNWPLGIWNQPIQATELRAAQAAIGASGTTLITGAAFNDTDLIARGDLDQYRVLHFATHGLVAPPRPQCPARPALLTSFGPAGSDGLLSFKEIYDLKLDADLVILSACDTAGKATVAATREAGITRGGGSALDGLVRAFVGAGGRSVLASHWPVPDDYDATHRLIAGLFAAPPGTSVAAALRTAQLKLMDDADTSHPYYWSAFAIVGDGAQPMLRSN